MAGSNSPPGDVPVVTGADEAAPAACRLHHRSAEELEPALMLERITAKARDETHAPSVQPLNGFGAVAHDRLGKIGTLRFDGPQVQKLVNVKIVAEALPLVFPHSFDGATAINRFRDAATG